MLFSLRLFIINFLLFFFMYSVYAQDIHFTQYINSHLTLNPALTGFFNGNLRANINYRSQWANVASPFITSAFSCDTKILQKKMKDNGFGAGVLIFTDRSGSAKLTNFMAMLSASYIRSLSTNADQYVSLGLQAGVFQKWFDVNKIRFDNQFDGLDFNSSQQSGENFPGNNLLKGDINTGIVYSRTEAYRPKYNAGISFFHLTQPKESFLNNENKRSLRSVFHSNVLFLFSEDIWIGPDLLFVYQKKAREISFGGSVIYKLAPVNNTDTYLNFSTGYRWSDAVNISTGLKYGKWIMSFSYDINISGLIPASSYQGGYELSLIYTDLIAFGKKKIPFIVPCTNF